MYVNLIILSVCILACLYLCKVNNAFERCKEKELQIIKYYTDNKERISEIKKEAYQEDLEL